MVRRADVRAGNRAGGRVMGLHSFSSLDKWTELMLPRAESRQRDAGVAEALSHSALFSKQYGTQCCGADPKRRTTKPTGCTSFITFSATVYLDPTRLGLTEEGQDDGHFLLR
jgi:hypothetical protein